MKAILLTCLIPLAVAEVPAAARNVAAGLNGAVGAGRGARVVRELRINKPGVHEDIIIDGKWGDHDLVRIRSDNVVLRNCTVRFGRRDAVEVYARNVLIENCRIHHVLAGSFAEQGEGLHQAGPVEVEIGKRLALRCLVTARARRRPSVSCRRRSGRAIRPA